MPTLAAPPVETSLDSSASSATTALYRAAIGPVNNDYYLPIFERFEAADRAGPSWNWAASLYTLNWMIFRHLHQAALLYLSAIVGAVIIVLGGGRLLFNISEHAEWGLLLLLVTISVVIPGLCGNALLHAASRKKMAHALVVSATLREACALLNQQASSRKRFIWTGAINLALAAACAGAYFAFMHTEAVAPNPAKTGKVLHQTEGQLASIATAPVMLPAPVATASAPAPAQAVSSPPVSPAAMAPLPLSPVSASAPLVTASAASSPKPAKPGKHAITPAKASSVKAPTEKAATDTTATADKPYAVNVGLFAKDNNALNAHAKLLNAGLPSVIKEFNTTKGRNTRVRVGPFKTRAEAEAAAEEIRALQLEAVVVKP